MITQHESNPGCLRQTESIVLYYWDTVIANSTLSLLEP